VLDYRRAGRHLRLFLQSGFVTLGFLGGASVDKYGGVNVTSIGDYYKPNHRFTGSGGNGDIGTMAKRVVYIILQEKRRFLERNDYTTTPRLVVLGLQD